MVRIVLSLATLAFALMLVTGCVGKRPPKGGVEESWVGVWATDVMPSQTAGFSIRYQLRLFYHKDDKMVGELLLSQRRSNKAADFLERAFLDGDNDEEYSLHDIKIPGSTLTASVTTGQFLIDSRGEPRGELTLTLDKDKNSFLASWSYTVKGKKALNSAKFTRTGDILGQERK